MNTTFLSFYLTVGVVMYCVWVAGTDETLLIVRYCMKRVEYQWVHMRMVMMRRRLKKELEELMDTYSDK